MLKWKKNFHYEERNKMVAPFFPRNQVSPFREKGIKLGSNFPWGAISLKRRGLSCLKSNFLNVFKENTRDKFSPHQCVLYHWKVLKVQISKMILHFLYLRLWDKSYDKNKSRRSKFLIPFSPKEQGIKLP